jgi:hypothetical protein
MVERKFNNDGHQFHQYHQHEQSFLILTKDSYSRKDRERKKGERDKMTARIPGLIQGLQ